MIFISAGHHHRKQGASFNGITEYSLTTKWADKIFELLGVERAVRVPNGFLREKVDFINKHRATLAVEIHFNSAKLWKDWNKDGVVDEGEMVNIGRGSETLYYPGSNKGLDAANHVQEALSAIFPPNRGAKEGWYKMNHVNGADFFLKKTNCTSLIIEPEFIDNLETLGANFEVGCSAIANALLEIEEGL